MKASDAQRRDSALLALALISAVVLVGAVLLAPADGTALPVPATSPYATDPRVVDHVGGPTPTAHGATPTPDPAAYPPPEPADPAGFRPTPDPTGLAMSNEAFAEEVRAVLEDRWTMIGAPTPETAFRVVAHREIWPIDERTIKVHHSTIAAGNVPDLAIIFEGAFVGSGEVYSYYMGLYDKGYGLYKEVFADHLPPLERRLP